MTPGSYLGTTINYENAYNMLQSVLSSLMQRGHQFILIKVYSILAHT